MSIASMLAIAVYLGVFACCLAAAHAAGRSPRRGDRLHWLATAALFAGLSAARLANLEEQLRDSLRGAVSAAGQYGERASWQLPLAIAVLIVGFGAAVWLISHWRRLPPRSRLRLIHAARAGLVLLAGLTTLRLLSFHFTDMLLYSGPVRLNWVAEGLVCLLVAGPALLYAGSSSRRGPRQR